MGIHGEYLVHSAHSMSSSPTSISSLQSLGLSIKSVTSHNLNTPYYSPPTLADVDTSAEDAGFLDNMVDDCSVMAPDFSETPKPAPSCTLKKFSGKPLTHGSSLQLTDPAFATAPVTEPSVDLAKLNARIDELEKRAEQAEERLAAEQAFAARQTQNNAELQFKLQKEKDRIATLMEEREALLMQGKTGSGGRK